jgi:predicted nucleotidyltransferase
VAEVLGDLRGALARILREKLAGLYLYGSLVTGDFDPGLSDIDLLAVTASGLTQAEIEALRAMHEALVVEHASWDDRVEVAYVSATDLWEFRTACPSFPVISPGEPFHLRHEALADWTANWYLIREAHVVLSGPPAHAMIPEVSARELLDSLKRYVGELRQRLTSPMSSGAESYAILTACRALYRQQKGLQTSKRRAGAWMQTEHPEWSALVGQALVWRYDPHEEVRVVQPETHALLEFITQQLGANDGSN